MHNIYTHTRLYTHTSIGERKEEHIHQFEKMEKKNHGFGHHLHVIERSEDD